MRCPHCGVEIEPKRSGRQQRTFHKLCASFSLASGTTAANAKVLFKHSYGVWLDFPFKGRPAPEWPGQFVEMYIGTPAHVLLYMKSEGAYTKREETRLIEGARIECYDIGADLSWMEDME